MKKIIPYIGVFLLLLALLVLLAACAGSTVQGTVTYKDHPRAGAFFVRVGYLNQDKYVEVDLDVSAEVYNAVAVGKTYEFSRSSTIYPYSVVEEVEEIAGAEEEASWPE